MCRTGFNHIAEELTRPSRRLQQGGTRIAIEVYAHDQAFVSPELIGTSIVYHRSFDQPRLTDVITIQ